MWRTIAGGVGAGICCGALSSVIAYYLFGGVTGGGVTWVTAGARSLGLSQPMAVLAGSLSTDILDKSIVILVVGILLRALPKRMLGRFPRAAQAVGK